jgi:hypothetical protein
MAKHYTVLFIDDKGSPVRESLISKQIIWFIVLAVVIGIGGVGTGVYKYINLRHALTENIDLLDRLNQQQTLIESQRSQIKTFAQEINTLKSTLISLNDFEQKIRIMANLEHKADQASLFAIGGSMPDDLDTELPLNQDHDRLIREMHDHMEQVEQASAVQQSSFEKLLKSLKANATCWPPPRLCAPSKDGYRLNSVTASLRLPGVRNYTGDWISPPTAAHPLLRRPTVW